MKFLVVEDDFVSRKLLQQLLTRYGEVDVAVDGNEALEAFALAHEEKASYDVICLDINMPNLDGHETLKALRSIEGELGIDEEGSAKVIMMTGVGDKESVLEAFRHGCEAYLQKPYSKSQIVDKLVDLGFAVE